MAELRYVRLPQDDRARPLDPLDVCRRDFGHVVRENPAPVGAAYARFEVEEVLDGHGHPVQGAQRRAGHEGAFGLPRGVARLVAQQGDVGVQRGILGVDSTQECVDHIDRREFPGGNPPGQLCGGHEADLFRCVADHRFSTPPSRPSQSAAVQYASAPSSAGTGAAPRRCRIM